MIDKQPPLRAGLLLCIALGAVTAASADDNSDEAVVQLAQRAARDELERQLVIHEGPETMRLALGETGSSERVVKGAPYCAEAIHETVQWLPDGSGAAPNRIVRQQSTQLCRDGEGRTRQEVQRGNRKLVYLRDPVARESWVLDAERKTARRIDLRAAGQPPLDGAAWREYAERMKEWARSVADKSRGQAGEPASPNSAHPPPPPPRPTSPTGTTPPTSATPPIPAIPPTPPKPPVPPAPPVGALPLPSPMPVVISRHQAAPGEVEVNVLHLRNHAGPAGFEWELPPPAVQWRAQSWAPRGAGSVTPLGGKDIDGLRAQGERTTWIIEAGKVGNEKPIQITREVWTAPELMVTLSSRDFDPRSGEVNYRLKNIKRGEPDPGLMRVPADYKTPPRPGGKASGPTGQG